MNKENGETLMQLSKETLVYEVLVTNDRLEAMEAMLDKAKEAIKGWEPVRHGAWKQIFIGLSNPWEARKCSECGYEDYVQEPHRYRYCPACGAKMDGGNENETT